jgi:hypothetical protein
VLRGLDGRKMSKSYGNTIPLFAPPEQQAKLIRRVVTDSRGPQEPKDLDTLVALLDTFAEPAIARDVHDRYRTGGVGYGDVKALLADQLHTTLRLISVAMACKPTTIPSFLGAGALLQQQLDQLPRQRVPGRPRELHQLNPRPTLELVRKGMAEGMDRRHRGDRFIEQLNDSSAEALRRELHLSQFVDDHDAIRWRRPERR